MEIVSYETLMEKPAIMFFVATRFVNREMLIEELRKYKSFGYYLMSWEISKTSHKPTQGEHFHFILFDFSELDYNAFRIKVLSGDKSKLKLQGQAKNGVGRQYGKETKIHNLFNACAYTLKDGNYESNIPPEIVQGFIDASFKKDDKSARRQELMDYLLEVVPSYEDYLDKLNDEDDNQFSKIINLYGKYFEFIRKEIYLYQVKNEQIFFNKSTTETTIRELIGKLKMDIKIKIELIYKLNY